MLLTDRGLSLFLLLMAQYGWESQGFWLLGNTCESLVSTSLRQQKTFRTKQTEIHFQKTYFLHGAT